MANKNYPQYVGEPSKTIIKTGSEKITGYASIDRILHTYEKLRSVLGPKCTHVNCVVNYDRIDGFTLYSTFTIPNPNYEQELIKYNEYQKALQEFYDEEDESRARRKEEAKLKLQKFDEEMNGILAKKLANIATRAKNDPKFDVARATESCIKKLNGQREHLVNEAK